MKKTFKTWFMGRFFHSSCKAAYARCGLPKSTVSAILAENYAIAARSKPMNDDRLISSYMMGMYFIAMNKKSGLSPQENYKIIESAIKKSSLMKKKMGSAEDYLSEDKLPSRMEWAEETRRRRGENNWVVDVLPKCAEYDLGYDYHECGICKLCRDEGCFELAKYLCKLDYVIADMMNVKLARTTTLADGGDKCDFRYSLK